MPAERPHRPLFPSARPADLVLGAYDAALQQAPIAVNSPAVDVDAYPLLRAVIYALMVVVFDGSGNGSIEI